MHLKHLRAACSQEHRNFPKGLLPPSLFLASPRKLGKPERTFSASPPLPSPFSFANGAHASEYHTCTHSSLPSNKKVLQLPRYTRSFHRVVRRLFRCAGGCTSGRAFHRDLYSSLENVRLAATFVVTRVAIMSAIPEKLAIHLGDRKRDDDLSPSSPSFSVSRTQRRRGFTPRVAINPRREDNARIYE